MCCLGANEGALQDNDGRTIAWQTNVSTYQTNIIYIAILVFFFRKCETRKSIIAEYTTCIRDVSTCIQRKLPLSLMQHQSPKTHIAINTLPEEGHIMASATLHKPRPCKI